jgi:hypothetical protein
MIPGVDVGGGCLAYTPLPEKILSLDPLKFFFSKKWENLAKKCHFLEFFWPTLEIFTNLL